MAVDEKGGDPWFANQEPRKDPPATEFDMTAEELAKQGLPVPPRGRKAQKPMNPKVLAHQFGSVANAPLEIVKQIKGGPLEWGSSGSGAYVPPSKRGPSGEPI